jgi:hypothetical protein
MTHHGQSQKQDWANQGAERVAEALKKWPTPSRLAFLRLPPTIASPPTPGIGTA